MINRLSQDQGFCYNAARKGAKALIRYEKLYLDTATCGIGLINVLVRVLI